MSDFPALAALKVEPEAVGFASRSVSERQRKEPPMARTCATILMFSFVAALAGGAGCADDGATGKPANSNSNGGTGGDSTGAGGSTEGTGGDPTGSGGSTGTGGDVDPGTGGATTGTGGGAGSVGMLACEPLVATDIISDFETGKADVAPLGGRLGSWFLLNDHTPGATQSPPKLANTAMAAEMGGACTGSVYAFHTTGTGFAMWAGVGVTFTRSAAAGDGGVALEDAGPGAAPPPSYDASAYAGIKFRAKLAKGTPGTVRAQVPDVNTDADGHLCVDTTDKTNVQRCGNHFGVDLLVGPDWADYDVPFGALHQSYATFGVVPTGALDAAHLFSLHLQIRGPAAMDYDLWVDDVRFYH
jgi:hypothetical protein